MTQYLYGKQPVRLRLDKQEPIHHLYLLSSSNWPDFLKLAQQQDIPVTFLNKAQLDKLAPGNHQGIVAQIPSYQTVSLEDLLTSVSKDKAGLLLMADGLTDPHNLGAILRTADATNVDGIIIGKHRSVSLNATVAKVAAGAIETVKVAAVTNLTQAINQCKAAGYWVFGTDVNQSLDYRLVDYTGPTLLVVGSEGKGLSRLVREACDQAVHIPMHGQVPSLNVSVATAVLLYEVNNQRLPIEHNRRNSKGGKP